MKIPKDYKGEPPKEEELNTLKEYYLSPFDRCDGCDDYWLDLLRDSKYTIEESSYCEKVDKTVCGYCIEHDNEYKNTVIVYDPGAGEVTKYLVGAYEDDIMTNNKEVDPDNLDEVEFDYEEQGESPIQFVYVRTDGWRGHHDPIVPEGWRNYHSDCILSWSEDAEELKKFDIDIKKMLWENEFEFAVCFGRTGDVFSCGYDILVKANKDDLKMFAMIVRLQQLRAQYRDGDRFTRTALTGSSEDTKETKLLVKAARMLEKGVDFEDVKEKIMEEMKK